MKNILFVILFFPVVLSAQRTVFVDTLAEYCLLEHLSLRVGDSIPQRAFDTITKLNCSGFGLSQIVDFAPCQNLKSINLRQPKTTTIQFCNCIKCSLGNGITNT